MTGRVLRLAVLLAPVFGPAPAFAESGSRTNAEANAEITEMASIPGGTYTPLYGSNKKPVEVAPFRLDRVAVTNGDFVRFVRASPSWRKSSVKRIFAEGGYLNTWKGDLDPGDVLDRPVTNVSWFAAKAYCDRLGKHLPRMDQWEFAAVASEESRDASRDRAFAERILEWYSRPSPRIPGRIRSTWKNVYGVYDLHGLIWEWVEDFNSVLMSGESRADRALDQQMFCGGGAVGAADPSDYAGYMRYAYRSSLKAVNTVNNLGFRCAKE